jgi:hypothetical protein
MNIELVPEEFRPTTNFEYPQYNTLIFEEYFMNYFIENKIETEYTYLPIMWQSYYTLNNFGWFDMPILQTYLDSLDRNKKYFTIVQYDEGILQDINSLDIFVFGQCGGGNRIVSDKNIGYPTPLICLPSLFIDNNKKKDIFCSFIGVIKGRHIIREKIYEIYKDKFLMSECINYDTFIDTMERSIFSLCPRGLGATSYRICESLRHGSIPVYISDRFWIPFKEYFNFEDIGILIHSDNIDKIESILRSKTKEDIKNYLINGEKIYNEFFTYEGCAKTIINKINSM